MKKTEQFEELDPNKVIEIVKILAEYFKTSFGPRGLDKLLFDKFNNNILVSNDGGTILKNLADQLNPKYSKFILNWGKILYENEKDGIKTFYIILSEFLKRIEELKALNFPNGLILDTINVINRNWVEFTEKNKTTNIIIDPLNNENFVLNYLKSIIAGKLSNLNINHLSKLALETIKRLGNYCLTPWFYPEYSLKIELIPGALISDSKIINGTIIGKEPVNLSLIPPTGIENPRIILVRQKLYLDLPDGGKAGPQGFEMEMRFNKIEHIAKFHEKENEFAEEAMVYIDKVAPNVVITEKGVDRQLESLLNKKGIILIRRAKTEDFEYLARFLDVKIIENLKEISSENVCVANNLNYEKIGRDYQIIIRNNISSSITNPKILEKKITGDIYSIPPIGTILICGSMWSVCEEVKRLYIKLIRSLIDLIKTKTFFYGGGNLELSLALFLRHNSEYLNQINENKSKIIYCYNHLIDSFLIIPRLLLESVGLDPLLKISELIARFKSGEKRLGVDLNQCQLNNMDETNIYDDFSSKKILYNMVFEILIQIIRIDKIFQIKTKNLK